MVSGNPKTLRCPHSTPYRPYTLHPTPCALHPTPRFGGRLHVSRVAGGLGCQPNVTRVGWGGVGVSNLGLRVLGEQLEVRVSGLLGA
ncbi:hypothetical protein T484DRAFT_2746156 [Baffinella frigidus]|nr:hypothetical protein T484DRAFT_2746156 [Cryptophyta sp. CCMP2293]